MGKTEDLLCSKSEDLLSVNVEKLPIIGAATDSTITTQPKQPVGHVILATLVAALGSLCFGYSLGYSSPALEDLRNEKDDSIRLNQDDGALFSSLVTLGALAGSPLGGFIVERLGRKATTLLSAVPSEIGWLLIVFAKNHAMMYAGRFIAGFGMGLVAVSVPTYIAEISSPKLRGALGSCHQLAITGGLLLAFVNGVYFKWRTVALAGAIIPVVLVIMMVFMPETPRWFLGHNKRGAAIKSLEWFRGSDGEVEQECYEIEATLDTHEKLSIKDFFHPAIGKPLIIGIGLMTFQQLCGAIVVVFNCATIFKAAGFNDSKAVSIIVGATQLGANLIACLIMDKIGRRFLLLSMALIMCISHIGLGTYFELIYIPSNSSEVFNSTVHHSGLVHSIPSTHISWIAITCIIVFNIAFSLSWGPVPWLLMGEIFPLRVRGIASSFATFSAWGSAFLVTWLFVTMQESLTVPGTYWFYAGCCFLSFIFVYILLPETKGRTLEEIEAMFENKRSSYVQIL